MLTDAEVRDIAENFVQTAQAACRSRSGRDDFPWWAYPMGELSPPPGVYFTVQDPNNHIDDWEGYSTPLWCSESGVSLDGFFVTREDGQVRVLTCREVRAAKEGVPPRGKRGDEVWCAISFLLTGEIPEPHPRRSMSYMQGRRETLLQKGELLPEWYRREWEEHLEELQRLSSVAPKPPRPWWKFWG